MYFELFTKYSIDPLRAAILQGAFIPSSDRLLVHLCALNKPVNSVVTADSCLFNILSGSMLLCKTNMLITSAL